MRCAFAEIPPDVRRDVLAPFLPLKDLWVLTQTCRVTRPLFVREVRRRLERNLREHGLKLPPNGILTGVYLAMALLEQPREAYMMHAVCADPRAYTNALVEMNPAVWKLVKKSKRRLPRDVTFPVSEVAWSAYAVSHAGSPPRHYVFQPNGARTKIMRLIQEPQPESFAFLEACNISVQKCAYDFAAQTLVIHKPADLFEPYSAVSASRSVSSALLGRRVGGAVRAAGIALSWNRALPGGEAACSVPVMFYCANPKWFCQ